MMAVRIILQKWLKIWARTFLDLKKIKERFQRLILVFTGLRQNTLCCWTMTLELGIFVFQHLFWMKGTPPSRLIYCHLVGRKTGMALMELTLSAVCKDMNMENPWRSEKDFKMSP